MSYLNQHGDIVPQTPLKKGFNLRWYIQHLTDENEDEDENPLNHEKWMNQTNWKVIKYVIHHKHFMTSEQFKQITEVWILQGIYPLKDEWVFGCSLKTRLADQTKTQQLKWLWSKDSMNTTINQRLVEQTQEMNFKLEGTGGSTLDVTLRKQYLSSSDE